MPLKVNADGSLPMQLDDAGRPYLDPAVEAAICGEGSGVHPDLAAHTHVENNNSATTGGLAGWAARDTSTNTSVATGYSTASATTGVTTTDPAGGVSALTHDSPSNLPPYVIVRMWKRTA